VNESCPIFDAALVLLNNWLVERKLPLHVIWVFYEDLTWYRKAFLLRLPVPPENASLARDWYDTGGRFAKGIRIDVNCFLKDSTVCSVWLPEDSCDLACWPHKEFRIHQHPAFREARSTPSNWLWQLARINSSLNGNTGPFCDIPSRRYVSEKSSQANL
jgi:hypothetical protein